MIYALLNGGTNTRDLTDQQRVDYCANLIALPTLTISGLTRAQASRLIDELKTS